MIKGIKRELGLFEDFSRIEVDLRWWFASPTGARDPVEIHHVTDGTGQHIDLSLGSRIRLADAANGQHIDLLYTWSMRSADMAML